MSKFGIESQTSLQLRFASEFISQSVEQLRRMRVRPSRLNDRCWTRAPYAAMGINDCFQ